MTATDTAVAAGELLGDLSELYGWALTGTESALLRASFAGRTRTEIATIAADTAGPSKILTPEQLRQALISYAADTPPRPGMPFHLPTCQCGGAGAMWAPATDPNGKPTSVVVSCNGNRGRRITVDQWERWQRESGKAERTDGKVADHHHAAAGPGLAAARAQLIKETTA